MADLPVPSPDRSRQPSRNPKRSCARRVVPIPAALSTRREGANGGYTGTQRCWQEHAAAGSERDAPAEGGHAEGRGGSQARGLYAGGKASRRGRKGRSGGQARVADRARLARCSRGSRESGLLRACLILAPMSSRCDAHGGYRSRQQIRGDLVAGAGAATLPNHETLTAAVMVAWQLQALNLFEPYALQRRFPASLSCQVPLRLQGRGAQEPGACPPS